MIIFGSRHLQIQIQSQFNCTSVCVWMEGQSSQQGFTGEKIKSFSLGIKKKSPFQLHKENQEKKRKQAEEETARALDDFVASFKEDSAAKTKTFVRGETVVNSAVVEASSRDRVYKPTPQRHPLPQHPGYADEDEDSKVSVREQKKKRSIDELKEELKK